MEESENMVVINIFSNRQAISIEEMSELMKAITKHIRDPNAEGVKDSIVEEVADVEIMLEQIKTIFYIGSTVDSKKEEKLSRLRETLEDG